MSNARLGFRVMAVGFVCAVVGTGCAEETISAMYAQEFHCPENKTTVDEIGGGRYRARGCDQTVMYECITSQQCVPTNGKRDAPTDSPSAPQVRVAQRTSTDDEVEEAHIEKNKHGSSTVSLDERLDKITLLKLRAIPADKQALQLKIVRLAGDDELDECTASVMINGSRMDLPSGKFVQGNGTNAMLIELAPQLVREFALARKFALKACDFRWTLSPAQVEEVRHFADLYQQEQAWAAPAHSGGTGGLVAPAEGWPAWKPAADVPAVLSGAALEGPALFKLLSPSIFKVVVSSSGATSQGSAVAISNKQLLTNCHVLDGAQKIVLKQGKLERPATIASADPGSDRCLLSVSDATLVPIRGIRQQTDLQVGEALYTLGSPNGLELSLSNGILSGVREEDGHSYVQTTAPISPGSSGGGLFDARGNLVGITTLVLVGSEHLNQSLNFAIPADAFTKP